MGNESQSAADEIFTSDSEFWTEYREDKSRAPATQKTNLKDKIT